jgi:hypothetical protein
MFQALPPSAASSMLHLHEFGQPVPDALTRVA